MINYTGKGSVYCISLFLSKEMISLNQWNDLVIKLTLKEIDHNNKNQLHGTLKYID